MVYLGYCNDGSSDSIFCFQLSWKQPVLVEPSPPKKPLPWQTLGPLRILILMASLLLLVFAVNVGIASADPTSDNPGTNMAVESGQADHPVGNHVGPAAGNTLPSGENIPTWEFRWFA